MRKPNYDKFPSVAVRDHDGAVTKGWPAICERLKAALAGRKRAVLAIECYSGVSQAELEKNLSLSAVATYSTLQEAFKPSTEIDSMVAGDLGGDDPIFGYYSRLNLADFLSSDRVAELKQRISLIREGLVVICGPGASLCAKFDLLVYADMPRWEEQLRQRRGECGNLGMHNAGAKASLLYKRSFFIDWRACDRLKQATLEQWDFLLDTTVPLEPRLVEGVALREGLRQTANRPFRVVPFFDPGPWGGQWMKEVCGLDPAAPNYAWCFDCVPEENSLLLEFGGERVEIPSQNLVLYQPRALLGEGVYGRFGAEFPIRFDFLDTMGGGNLSFQVHPLVGYAQEHFGLHYTQDESYYMLEAGDDAVVYLGLKEGARPEEMIRSLEDAQAGKAFFDDEKFVAKWPAKKHDHFLIPAGTCHCSGANSMVLEISHTPYIFTFKLWDWNRLGLDGKPRPINIGRGKEVIQWDRTEAWVRDRLVNAITPIAEGEGWREERTGLYESQFIETRRHWFTRPVAHHTHGNLNVLNLVQGEEAMVESPEGAFEPFIAHYAETFIIPASVGPYIIKPLGSGECATMKAFVRISA